MSMAVIFMEWFVVPKKRGDAKGDKVYRCGCAALYVLCGVLRCVCDCFLLVVLASFKKGSRHFLKSQDFLN